VTSVALAVCRESAHERDLQTDACWRRLGRPLGSAPRLLKNLDRLLRVREKLSQILPDALQCVCCIFERLKVPDLRQGILASLAPTFGYSVNVRHFALQLYTGLPSARAYWTTTRTSWKFCMSV
jgi:hypothetical protein